MISLNANQLAQLLNDRGWYVVGYLDEYPEYSTQGTTLDELKYMLGDILDAIRVGDLVS